jgi:hypothetical protein
MVDILVPFCYGYRLGAVSEMAPSAPRSSPPELCTAIAHRTLPAWRSSE